MQQCSHDAVECDQSAINPINTRKSLPVANLYAITLCMIRPTLRGERLFLGTPAELLQPRNFF